MSAFVKPVTAAPQRNEQEGSQNQGVVNRGEVPIESPEAMPTVAGMGPIPTDHGVAFRVWAPNASAVSVIGDFNDWNPETDPLQRESGDTWYGFVEQAKVGSKYKYRIVNGDQTFDRIDPRVREVTNSVGEGIVHDPDFDWQGDAFQMRPWNELVIYETHIGTFNRTNPEAVGTFQDYIERFDHLRKLGVNALQVMPIAEFAGDLSWGYNPAHPYAIESAYGGPDAFKTFVREAHKNGFAVILDVVYNHFGPSDLDLWQFDGWQENNKGGIYFFNDHRSSTPWGDTRPDYGRGEVRSYIRDNAMMWLEDYHVDGLRYDMTLYIRALDAMRSQELPEGWSLTQWINEEIRAYKPTAITIAEDLQNDSYLTKSAAEGGAAFGSQWDAGFVHPIRDVLIQPSDEGRSMEKVRDALYHKYNHDVFQRVIYTESHDEVANGKARVPSEVDPEHTDTVYAQKRATLGSAIVMTAPGIPMLFQGQEFLEDGWFQDHVPLDWEKDERFAGLVKLHTDLISLRTNRNGNTRGLTCQGIDVYHVNDKDKTVCFHRFDQTEAIHQVTAGDDVVVVANFSNATLDNYRVGFPASGLWKLRLSTDSKYYSDEFGNRSKGDAIAEEAAYDGKPFSAVLRLPPYTALIFSQDPA